MQCPKCQFEQSDHNQQCQSCGIFFAKYHARQTYSDYEDSIKKQARKRLNKSDVDPSGWKYIAIGVIAGFLLSLLDNGLIKMTLGILITLVHELGHTITAWLFGIPAIPAFDFMHGGGLTINFEQKTGLLIGIYALGIFLLYWYRNNKQSLFILLGIGLFHLIATLTSLSEILILFMGHGVELVMATVFIYRSLTNTAIVHQIERPLYSIIGFYIVFHDLIFSWKLMNDAGYRIEYEAQKGGYHFGDFSRIAEQHLAVDLSTVALFFFLCCLAIPLISFYLWRYHEQLSDWFYKRLVT